MNDSPSGSRWEPGPDDEPTTETPAPEAPAAEATPVTPATLGGRRSLAAAGAGLLLVGGLSGFAIGHASGDDGSTPTQIRPVGTGGLPGEGGFPAGPPDGDRDGDGFGPRGGPSGVHPGIGQDDSQGPSGDTAADPDSDDT